MLDDDTYLSSDNSYNLMTLRKNGDAATDEDRNRLEVRCVPTPPMSRPGHSPGRHTCPTQPSKPRDIAFPQTWTGVT